MKHLSALIFIICFSAKADVISIQGTEAMTALKTDGSDFVQPVSGPLTNTELRATPLLVSGSFYPVTQPVSGSLSVSNFPSSQAVTGSFWQATQPVSGPLTDAQIRATALPVSGTFFQSTQPISAVSLPLPSGSATSAKQDTGNTSLGNIDTKTPSLGQATMANSRPVVLASNQSSIPVTGTFFQPTQPVSVASMPSTPVTGTFWQSTQPVSISSMPTTPVTGTFWQATQPISGSVSVSNFPASQAVTGTFFQATQPVSGPLTDTQLRASAVPVSGSFFQATQPVSIASMPSTPVTGTFWQATQPVSGPLTDAQIRATALPVSGTFFQATQPVSGTVSANATLSAETTKVIGTVNVAAAQTIATTQSGTWTVQPGNTANSTPWLVKEQKDFGRNQTNFFMAIQIVSTATDALMSLTGYKSGAAVVATTTPAVVTAGKTYRITSITMDYTTIVTTPGSVRFTLRANTGGVVAITSPAVATWEVGEPTGIAPVAGKKNTVHLSFADGIEFAAGTGIGVSMVGLSAVGVAAVVGYGRITLAGFEY